MAMMDALVRYEREPETYAIREMPIPVIGPEEVLVAVAYAGSCDNDTVIFCSEDIAKFPCPVMAATITDKLWPPVCISGRLQLAVRSNPK